MWIGKDFCNKEMHDWNVRRAIIFNKWGLKCVKETQMTEHTKYLSGDASGER